MDTPTKQSKKWVKPELIILARSQPEEAVLTCCKNGSHGTVSGTRNYNCYSYSCRDCKKSANS